MMRRFFNKWVLVLLLAGSFFSVNAQMSFDEKLTKLVKLSEIRNDSIYSVPIYKSFMTSMDEMVEHPDFMLESFQNKNLDTFSFTKNDEAFSFYFQGINVKFASE